jgi:hypothetical protein
MAWFYNPILPRFFRIGLLAPMQRRYSPAATMVHKSAFSLGNSQIQKFRALARPQKTGFSMARSFSPIFAIFRAGSGQFGLF